MKLHCSEGSFDINTVEDVLRLERLKLFDHEKQVLSILNQWFVSKSLLIETSGSTGKPASIKLSETLLSWSVNQTSLALDLKDESVFLCLASDKIGGAMMVLRSVMNNWELTVAEPSADPFSHLPINHNFTFVSLVPYQLTQILKDEASCQKLACFNHVLIGGAAISTALEAKIFTFTQKHKTQFFHTYGMTETASHVALRHISSQNTKASFTLQPGVAVTLKADGRAQVSIPEINFEVLTNDLLTIDGNQLNYLGRYDDVVNSGGLKIQLADVTTEIQHLIDKNDLHLDFFLWKEPHADWGEMLVMVVSDEKKVSSLMSILHASLDSKLCPKKVYSTHSFLRTTSGKLDRLATLVASVKIGG